MDLDYERLVTAVETNDIEEAEYLLYNGVNPNSEDKYTYGLLYKASLKNNLDMLRLLLRYGADPNFDSMFEKVTCNAIGRRKLEILDLLLENGADPNTKCSIFGTLLHYAIIYAIDHTIVELLLFYGADPTIKNRDGLDAYEQAQRMMNHELDEFIRSYPYQELKEPGSV